MTMNATTTDKMKAVKEAWDKAPEGAKKDTALTHYQAAEQAHSVNDEAGCVKCLDAASHALA